MTSRPSLRDDRPWEHIAPVMFDDDRWAAAEPEVELAVGLLGLRPPAAVLDLACGPGRHAMALARRGFRVTGVDATAAFLETAATVAASEGLSVELVHEDMRQFRRLGGFDAVLSMSTSFGYFEDAEDDLRVLRNIRRSLSSGGRLLIELVGKEVVARTLKGRDWREEEGVVLLIEQSVRDDWTWADNRLVFLAGEGREEFVLSYRLYSASELSALLDAAGFPETAIFGSLAGAPYDAGAERLVIVAGV